MLYKIFVTEILISIYGFKNYLNRPLLVDPSKKYPIIAMTSPGTLDQIELK